MERKNAVIVAFGRSAIAKAIKGSLRSTGCVDFGSQVLKGILAKNPGFDPALASGIFLTACTDTLGFFTFLGLATLVLLQ